MNGPEALDGLLMVHALLLTPDQDGLKRYLLELHAYFSETQARLDEIKRVEAEQANERG